ncbi:hypothetical protein [Halorussus sp. MSC15.2]|uniref:hypothetical protein n=1 Tax=Halorussus sp. MSC15.2 TaxID=2283638 RepID=UPI0013D4CA05|nr:hypothetical protein [Halorussus sp. MSC15.2]NEU56876.1 hypothetical protein [Halorussus sp. MSC15.2]
MRRYLRNNPGFVRLALAILVVCLLGLAFASMALGRDWQRIETLLLPVAAVLTALLLFKAAAVVASIGLRFVLSLGD